MFVKLNDLDLEKFFIMLKRYCDKHHYIYSLRRNGFKHNNINYLPQLKIFDNLTKFGTPLIKVTTNTFKELIPLTIKAIHEEN